MCCSAFCFKEEDWYEGRTRCHPPPGLYTPRIYGSFSLESVVAENKQLFLRCEYWNCNNYFSVILTVVSTAVSLMVIRTKIVLNNIVYKIIIHILQLQCSCNHKEGRLNREVEKLELLSLSSDVVGWGYTAQEVVHSNSRWDMAVWGANQLVERSSIS